MSSVCSTLIRGALPTCVQARVIVMRFESRGLWRRLYNIIQVSLYQGDVNHIAGDVHYVALLLKPGRTLLTVLDCVSLERLKGWRRALLLLFWYWLPAKRCAMISVISESTKSELLKYVRCSPSKIRIVYCPVDDIFTPDPKPFCGEMPCILQVGTGQNKNLFRVAEALCGIPCHLRVVGRLSDEQREVLLANQVEYSSVIGISDEQMVQEYRACDMLVFASTYEGFGLPIVEAQATGRPVVTSNVYSMPEVAGDAACLVDPFSIDGIRQGILRIIQNDDYRAELIRKGLKNIERFRPAVIASQYIDIYQELYFRGSENKAKSNA